MGARRGRGVWVAIFGVAGIGCGVPDINVVMADGSTSDVSTPFDGNPVKPSSGGSLNDAAAPDSSAGGVTVVVGAGGTVSTDGSTAAGGTSPIGAGGALGVDSGNTGGTSSHDAASDVGTADACAASVDLRSDPANCGSCGHACEAGQVCLSGQCCAAPALSGSICNVYPTSCGCGAGKSCYPNVSNSGPKTLQCYTNDGTLKEGDDCRATDACPGNLGCFGGTCRRYCNDAADCPKTDGVAKCAQTTWASDSTPVDGVKVCNNVCDPVHPQSPKSPLKSCPAAFGCLAQTDGASGCIAAGAGKRGDSCSSVTDCGPGLYCSSGHCYEYCYTDTDCGPNQKCSALSPAVRAGSSSVGVCSACTTGLSDCSGACVDKNTTSTNCGTCGHACTAGQSCSGGTCVDTGACTSAQTQCSGTCVDNQTFQTSPVNCGACGKSCRNGQACIGGACACPELVQDGSFESGGTTWTQKPGVTGTALIVSDSSASSGSHMAKLGGTDSRTDVLYQSVALPASSVGGTLSFNYRISTNETGTKATDKLAVALYRASDSTFLDQIGVLWNLNATSTWKQFSRPIRNDWAGQNVYVAFVAVTNDSLPTTFYVDSVSVTPCGGITVPWTCPSMYYGAGDGCNCGCGAADPDCSASDLTTCSAGWTCNTKFRGTTDGCDCGCGIADPDCASAAASSCNFCNGPGSCNTAPCQDATSTISSSNNAVCTGVTPDGGP